MHISNVINMFKYFNAEFDSSKGGWGEWGQPTPLHSPYLHPSLCFIYITTYCFMFIFHSHRLMMIQIKLCRGIHVSGDVTTVFMWFINVHTSFLELKYLCNFKSKLFSILPAKQEPEFVIEDSSEVSCKNYISILITSLWLSRCFFGNVYFSLIRVVHND